MRQSTIRIPILIRDNANGSAEGGFRTDNQAGRRLQAFANEESAAGEKGDKSKQ